MATMDLRTGAIRYFATDARDLQRAILVTMQIERHTADTAVKGLAVSATDALKKLHAHIQSSREKPEAKAE